MDYNGFSFGTYSGHDLKCEHSEQQPLKLSEAEMEEIISVVGAEAITYGSTAPAHGTQTGKVAVEVVDVAASVLIKLLIDM